ncbi:MAG: hypothetical protein O2854_05225 [Chloroflexi bacterium]|nr:hypothetical protein [Chloroflexota bacterium]
MYLPVDAFWSELGPLALTFFQEGYGGLGLELLGMAREREFRISDQILFGLTVDCDSEVESVFRSFDLSGGITDIPPVTDAIRVRAAFILLALSILIVPEPDDFTSPLNEACTRLYYAFGTMPPGIFPEPDVRASYENARSSSTSDDPSLTLSEDQFWRQIEFAYTALYDGDVQGEFLAAIANLRDAREMEENTYVALGRLFVRNCL